jgi:hypothetical protein
MPGATRQVKARSAPRHSKIANGAGEMEEMRRFARPGNPDRETAVHPAGLLPSIREACPPGERGAGMREERTAIGAEAPDT